MRARIPNTTEVNRLRLDNLSYPERLVQIPRSQWPPTEIAPPATLKEMWRSKKFLVQVHREPKKIIRLSIMRTDWDFDQKRAPDGITWEELQELKSQAGYYDRDAVEVYPNGRDVVNVANMRHLWILPQELDFKWRKPI